MSEGVTGAEMVGERREGNFGKFLHYKLQYYRDPCLSLSHCISTLVILLLNCDLRLTCLAKSYKGVFIYVVYFYLEKVLLYRSLDQYNSV